MQFTFVIFVFVISNLVDRRWKTISPDGILKSWIVNSLIKTSDSKEAKKEGWLNILDLLTSHNFPLIIAIIDILETATDFI